MFYHIIYPSMPAPVHKGLLPIVGHLVHTMPHKGVVQVVTYFQLILTIVPFIHKG